MVDENEKELNRNNVITNRNRLSKFQKCVIATETTKLLFGISHVNFRIVPLSILLFTSKWEIFSVFKIVNHKGSKIEYITIKFAPF